MTQRMGNSSNEPIIWADLERDFQYTVYVFHDSLYEIKNLYYSPDLSKLLSKSSDVTHIIFQNYYPIHLNYHVTI